MMRAIFIGASLVLLAGCNSSHVRMRDLPAERPAETQAAALDASRMVAPASPSSSQADSPPLTAADAPSMQTYDPWERINRFTYRFNARFDDAIFLPVANGYRRLPQPVLSGARNFFSNLTEVVNTINFTLQGRVGLGARSLGRFAINTTVGIAGLFDVAKKWNLPNAPTGFSDTLAKWGMHPGPFLVLPILGPSSLRDGVGLAGDLGVSTVVNAGNLYQSNHAWLLGTVDTVNQRASSDFQYYATGSAFEYETIRFLYMRKRLIEDEGLRKHEVPQPRDAHAPAGQ